MGLGLGQRGGRRGCFYTQAWLMTVGWVGPLRPVLCGGGGGDNGP
jgi:hypothetical protein